MSQSNWFVCNFELKNFDVFKKETQNELTFTVDGLINGGGEGLVSRIIYSFENGWAYIWRGLKVVFYGIKNQGLFRILKDRRWESQWGLG